MRLASPIRRGEIPVVETVSHEAPEPPGPHPQGLNRWRAWTEPKVGDGRTVTGWPYNLDRPESYLQNGRDGRIEPVNTAELVYPVDLSGDALHAINPQWSATRLLARLLSVKRWGVSGSIEGVAAGWEFDAGSQYIGDAEGDGMTWPPATDFRGWLPFVLSVLAEDEPGRPLSEWSLRLEVLASSAYTGEGRTQWVPRTRTMAGMSGGRPVVGPSIRGTFRYARWSGGEDRVKTDSGEWVIQSAPPPLEAELPLSDVLPVMLAGFPLVGWRRDNTVSEPFTRLPAGELRIAPVSFWGPDEWRD